MSEMSAPPPSTSGTRGVRNNNPGNIDRDKTAWLGLAADQSGDPRFCIFTSAEYGIRAIAKILESYQADGFQTVSQMIGRWAPRTENNTSSYVTFVASRMAIDPNTSFDIHIYNLCFPMVNAIIAQECADYVYPVATVDAALAMAGITPAVG